MNIEPQDAISGGGIVAAIAAAFATVKVGLYNKVGYRAHEQICSGVQKEIYDKIDKNHTVTIAYLMEIKETLGELKGRK